MPIEVINLPTAQRSSATTDSHEGTVTNRAQADNSPSNRSENKTENASYTDTVTLTETATQLQAIATEIEDIPIVNMARVEAIQYRLESGEFEIDSHKLADNILRIETQLN
ncbi:MAG: flagellar biosynthesis anti-sigma factor FlgM [Thiotrichaceae bacterium]|nr:flagellar biosynthesis anti-sigma factor FlgM [Thiotrichaceae bacterium]PCI15092.1 MAG: flagellar biosynthesis anti-sigma factor FlgM [Thiotrichales bacterium]